jgi:hypothetical protein
MLFKKTLIKQSWATLAILTLNYRKQEKKFVYALLNLQVIHEYI